MSVQPGGWRDKAWRPALDLHGTPPNLLPLQPLVGLPPGQQSIALPSPAQPRSVALAAQPYPDALLATLQSQDAFYGAPGEAPAADRPNPVLAAPRPQPLLLPNLLPLPPPNSPLPPGIYILDLPTARIRPTPGFEATYRLAGQDTIYGAPGQAPAYDYPSPRTPTRPILDTPLGSFGPLLSAVVASLPLNNPILDLPARILSPSGALRTVLSTSLLLPLSAVPTLPPGQQMVVQIR